MRARAVCVFVLCAAALAALASVLKTEDRLPEGGGLAAATDDAQTGCRACHGEFYGRWAHSAHGRTYEPYSDEAARRFPGPRVQDIGTAQAAYTLDLRPGKGYATEKGSFPWSGVKRKIDFILGGRRVIFLFSKGESGRFEALPFCYDVPAGKWVDIEKCGVAHALAGRRSEEGRLVVFDTGCRSCHIGPDPDFYELRTDSYRELPKNPGISCSACHGDTAGHAEAARAGRPTAPGKAGMVVVRGLDPSRRTDLCAACHSTTRPLTAAYKPGQPLFDHFDPVTLEDPAVPADGRVTGGTAVFTSWLANPCARSRRLDCTYCHEPGGGFRFRDKARVNDACLACHKDKAKRIEEHTHHKASSAAGACITCHMALPAVGGGGGADHSMLPPMPALSSSAKVPNGCNACHLEGDPRWAQGWVRAWYRRDFQAPYLERAKLVEDARAGEWSRLDEMVSLVASNTRSELYAASLLRLLNTCPSPSKEKALRPAMKDPSPLIRASAADGLSEGVSRAAADDLQALANDPVRLVRVRAAAAAARIKTVPVSRPGSGDMAKASGEYISSLMARPDRWTSHVDMGVHFLERGDARGAILSFKAASKLEPRACEPHVNLAMAYAALGDANDAETELKEALRLDPANAPALFNMGLLMNQKGEKDEAVRYLKEAFKNDPGMAEAAYNLAMLVAEKNPKEAVYWARRAYQARADIKYAFALAYFLKQDGDWEEAIGTARGIVARDPSHLDAYLLMGEIYEKKGRPLDAEKVYRQAIAAPGMSEEGRKHLEKKLKAFR